MKSKNQTSPEARRRAEQLSIRPIDHYQLSWLIHDEIGIKSRNTLWRYLHE